MPSTHLTSPAGKSIYCICELLLFEKGRGLFHNWHHLRVRSCLVRVNVSITEPKNVSLWSPMFVQTNSQNESITTQSLHLKGYNAFYFKLWIHALDLSRSPEWTGANNTAKICKIIDETNWISLKTATLLDKQSLILYFLNKRPLLADKKQWPFNNN